MAYLRSLRRAGRLLLAFLALGVVGLGLLVLLTPSVKRCIAYAHVTELWVEHWPLTRAKYAPISAGPWLNKIGVVRPTRVQVEPGVSIRIDPTDSVLRKILLTGAWEPGTWKAIDSHLPEGGTFIDVGAHVGYHSLKAAKKVGPGGRVIAIEPNPEAIRQLRENIEASDAGQIVV